jgi:hypothetical protein
VLEVPLAYWKQYTAAIGGTCAFTNNITQVLHITSLVDIYTVGEVDDGDPAINAPYQGALSGTLNYPMYWALRHAYQEKASMHEISSQWQQVKTDFSDAKLLGLFVDNHDNPRFLSINADQTALTNALAWILFAEVGNPHVVAAHVYHFCHNRAYLSSTTARNKALVARMTLPTGRTSGTLATTPTLTSLSLSAL